MLLFLALFSWASADEPDLSATADQIEAVAEEAPVSAGEAPAVVGDETNAPEEVADESGSEETVVELAKRIVGIRPAWLQLSHSCVL